MKLEEELIVVLYKLYSTYESNLINKLLLRLGHTAVLNILRERFVAYCGSGLSPMRLSVDQIM